MPDITNINLVYHRKARGIAPLSRYALQEDGGLLVSAPDELEVRTFHLVRFAHTGRAQIAQTFSVETLRKTEIAPDGAAFLGITDDDLYLFREARKTRFLPDRRASYTDIALSGLGNRFAAAFSDLLGSGHTVALGDVSGRLLWTKDLPFEVTRVAVDREAVHIAAGGATGEIVLLDSSRQTVWVHRQEAPIRALATAGVGRTAFCCGGPEVASGGAGLIDREGRLLWFTELVGTPVDVALDAEGRTVAVLLQLDNVTGRIVFLSADGMPTWDIDFDDARPTGLSLSATGQRAAVSLRDGTLVLYELQYGDRMAELSDEAALAEAKAARDAGNLPLAVELLQARLASVASDVSAGALLADLLGAWKVQAIAAAENAEAVGDFPGAAVRLDEVPLPLDADLVERRRALRRRWSEDRVAAGAAALAEGATDAAEAAYLSALLADPLGSPARVGLANARYEAAQSALEKGRQLLAVGDATAALEALAEARRRGATGPEVNGLVHSAQVVEALRLGNALYQDRQYAAALFQFKKVLRLDPDNAEALQKVSYAQNFLQDTQLSDRFSRLE